MSACQSYCVLTLATQGYPFPLSVTMIHLIIKFLIAWIVRKLISLVTGNPPLVLGWKEYVKNVSPVGMHVHVHVQSRSTHGLGHSNALFVQIEHAPVPVCAVRVFLGVNKQ